MILKYDELLPSFLKGNNIKKHGNNIDNQNNLIYDKISLLNVWNQLNRPILVEKNQTHNNYGKYIIHINTTYPLKQIHIECYDYWGDIIINQTFEYRFNDTVINETKSVDIFDQLHSSIWIKMKVSILTYDGVRYEKGYPENDEKEGSIYDHDEYLDFIGLLIGIPRRKYYDWISESDDPDIDVRFTSPKYCVKYDENNVMYPGNEDDYFYSLRLQYYLENYGKMFLPELILRVLYGWEDITSYNQVNRTTSLVSGDENSFYLFTTEEFEPPLNIDITGLNEYINRFSPLTRNVSVRYLQDTGLTANAISIPASPNNFSLAYDLTVAGTSKFINKAPIQVSANDIDRIIYTDANKIDSSTGEHKLDIFGVVPRDTGDTLRVQYIGEYELLPSNTVTVEYDIQTDFSLNVEDWQYNNYGGSSSSTRVPPRINIDGYLSLGQGVISYTPGLYKPLENDCIITIYFRYGRRYSRIGLTTINVRDDDSAEWNGNYVITPYDYLGTGDYNTTHTLEIIISNGEMIFVLDGTECKRISIIEDVDMLYVAGYTSDNESDTRLYGLYVEYIEISEYNGE